MNYRIYLSLGLLLFSLLLFLINGLYFHFPGNLYIPDAGLSAGLILILIRLGLRLTLPKDHPFTQWMKAIGAFYLVMFLIALTSTAIQFTPFPPIDKKLLTIEAYLSLELPPLLAWTADHPYFKFLLGLSYDVLAYEIAFLPLIIAAMKQYSRFYNYLNLMLGTALLGFFFYYFFPTTAPASNLSSPYFTTAQYATGIKFMEIHQHLQPSTMEGGLIAMPSFHTIWAFLCSYLAWENRLLFALSFILNGLIISSCVLLGWHYFIDILGSLIILSMAYFFLSGHFLKSSNTSASLVCGKCSYQRPTA